MDEPVKRQVGTDGDSGERPTADFTRSLPMALLRAREAVMARVRPALRAHGVSEQQWRVLRTLADSEGLEATQLARRVFLLRPSLTRIVRDLQARGLVGRRPTGPTLRRSLLFITEAGFALIAETAPDAARANAEIRALLGEDQLDVLKQALFSLEAVLTGGSKPPA
jgi:homoprotocatechuate degradation regulator HpaR